MLKFRSQMATGLFLKVLVKFNSYGANSRDYLKKSRKLTKIKNYKSALELDPFIQA